MKIYFLSPPSTPRFIRSARWEAADKGGTAWYPIWLAYTAGVVSANHEVRLVDAQAWRWSPDDVIEDAQRFAPDLVVFECSFSKLTSDIKIAQMIKHRQGQAKIIAVGSPCSQFPDKILRHEGIDIVARFEYDFTVRDIADRLEQGKNLTDVKGISYKENGEIIHNPDREFITSEELNTIPFVSQVYKKHLNIKDYFLSHTFYPEVQIFTGRGCPNRCTFCSWPETLMGRKYRVRDIKNVVDEFEYINQELPEVKEVFIEDDTFTVNRKRVREFCEEINRRKLDVVWSCDARADLDYETMRVMKQAGCRLLDVGYESGNDEILRNIKKGITTEQARQFTRDAKRAGLVILADFIVGLPGETKETVAKTLKFIRELKPDLMQLSVATPIPGTEFYQWARDNGFLLIDDLEQSLDEDGNQKPVISYPELNSEDISRYINKGLKQYYLNPSYVPIAVKRLLRKNGLSEMRSTAKAAKAFLRYAVK